MKRYTVAQARASISAILDSVEHGEVVVIRRRSSSFRVVREKSPASTRKKRTVMTWADPLLLRDNWSWQSTRKGLVLRERKKK